jgi:hypothetical protein
MARVIALTAPTVLTACGGSAQDDSAASRPHPPATLGGVVMSDPVPASIALLEITVDPQRDTPARLAAYQKMFGSPQPAWTLATATTAAATAALWKFFHVYYHRQPTDDPDATDWLTGQKLTYDVEHSNTLIFLSADGKQRYIVDAAADTGDNRPPPTLIRFMTPQGRHNLYHPSPGGSWTVPQAMQVLSWLAGRTIAPGGS